MPNLSLEPEEGKSNPQDTGRILPTEEEVRRLREELLRKEQMLREIREKEQPKPEVAPVEVFERKKEKVEKEKEKIRVMPEKPKKAPPAKVTTPPKIKDADLARDLASVMALDKPKQVKMLVFLSFKKGINYAANLAAQLKDPYLLDEFHDTLVDHLYDLLVKKRKIK
jgi:hypothetical protein